MVRKLPKPHPKSTEPRRATVNVLVLVFLGLFSLVSLHQQSVSEDFVVASQEQSRTSKVQHSIPVHNASNYVQSDVSKIIHVPAQSRIEIHLNPKSTRSCQNPVFWGRISGWSLSMIRFETNANDNDNDDTDVVVGTYDVSQMPVSGTYFVEIIVLLCEGYGKDFLNAHLKDYCLVNASMANHRITAGNETSGNESASIHIEIDQQPVSGTSSNLPDYSLSRRQWLHKSIVGLGLHQTTNNRLPPQPKALYTRYQPEQCNRPDLGFGRSSDSSFCLPLVSSERFEDYTFRWTGPDEIRNDNALGLPLTTDGRAANLFQETNTTQPPNIGVCFVGASHSRTLDELCRKLQNQILQGARQGSQLSFTCTHLQHKFPYQVTEDTVNDLRTRHCTHAVVGLFQFPFSKWQKDPNFTLSDFARDMTNVTRLLENSANDPHHPLRRVILRSAHTNGLKWEVIKCPVKDFRTPLTAALATASLRRIAQGLSPLVSFLDTSFIVDPVWDAADDWSHYSGEAGEVETAYILSEILTKELEGYSASW